jgi:valyl-tRNA synthetase
MESLYKPEGVEERWQRTWETEGHYNADPDPNRESFVIAHPPPNVTGDLHMGHAMQLSLADTIVRTRRMQGYNTLFQPGFDHAGISTQNAVEKHLAAEGKTRQDLGREAFEARVWEWLREYGGKIMLQFRRIGASMDYRRERFTMDDDYVRAVMHFFVHLYGKGWIYRANRIINWCPFHQTALSDLEVAHVEVDDALSYVRYPLADGDGHITIATVRPATILADVAVAVHPDDDRYRRLVGREVIVPVVGRHVPVIADERVERDFGTGALKVTPGHDPLDYEIGRDHGLPELTAIGPDGRMNEEAGDLCGLTQEEADVRVLAWLKEHDQLEKRESYRHTVAVCDRCQSRIEPRISLQWWCSMAEVGGGGGGKTPPPHRCAPDASVTTPSRSTASRSSRSRRRPTGTSPARSGGDISCPSGNARRGTSPWRRRSPGPAATAARRSWLVPATCSTRGSRRPSGPLRRSAGPRTRRTYARFTPAI